MKAKALEKQMKKALGESVLESRIQVRRAQGGSHESIWARIRVDALLPAAEFAMSFENSHFSVISGTDLGEGIELLYHFCIGHGGEEVACTFCIPVEKGGSVPTITGIVPGAVLSEREKMEFFGIGFDGLRDKRRAFLTGDLSKCRPWIRGDPETERVFQGGGKR